MLIDDAESLPSSTAYRHRFGSLIKAYRLVGFVPSHDYTYLEINKSLREIHPKLLERIVAQLREAGAQVEDSSDVLRINREYSASIALSRYRHTQAGASRWLVRFRSDHRPDITIVARMDAANQTPEDYYLIPHIDLDGPTLRLAQYNGAGIDTYRFENLDYFVGLSLRQKVEVIP